LATDPTVTEGARRGVDGVRLSTLTRRRLATTIAGLATPVVLGQLSQTLMGLVDTLMVGRLGESQLAAVAVATLLFSALAMTIKAVDVAAQTFTARRVGEQRDTEVGAVLTTAVTVCLGAGSVLMVVGLRWPGALMSLATLDPSVHEMGRQYLVYRYAGMLPLLFFFQAKAVFDGIGWTRIGMGVGIGMNVVNALLNWVFIFGKWGAPALGVGGAALASTISAGLAAVVIAGFLLHGPTRRRFRLVCRTNFKRALIRPFLKLAWPPAVQTFGIVIALVAFNYLLGLVGTLAVATGNVVLRIASLSFMPGVGVGAAVQTLVGQSLGRADPRGARRAALGGVALSVAFMGLFGVFFLATPAFFLRLFSGSEALIAAGTPILRLMGLVQVIDAVGLTLSGALRGAGLTREVMLVDVATGLVLLPPLTYLFAIVMAGGLMGAWLALLTWFTLYAVGMVWVFARCDWKEVRI
jgi:putative MATE family efflux protein